MSSDSDLKERNAIAVFLSTPTEESFCALFDAFYIRLCRYFAGRSVARETAEELAENVLYQVYRHAAQLRDGKSFHGWLFQIARNELLQHVRRQATALPTVEYEPLANYLAETLPGVEVRETGESFREWLSHMDATAREILVLRFVEDLDYPDISQVLGIPVGTIKWKVFQAKTKLAALLNRKKESVK